MTVSSKNSLAARLLLNIGMLQTHIQLSDCITTICGLFRECLITQKQKEFNTGARKGLLNPIDLGNLSI
jgi:hypothetical protein